MFTLTSLRLCAGACLLVALSGCGNETSNQADTPPRSTASEAVPPAVRSGSIIGKTTQEIRDAQTEESAGAQRVRPRVTGNDPITISGSAYVSIIGQAAQLQIKHAVDVFHALNGRYPKDTAEFMQEVIKANGIRLPQLPSYQEYAYDAAEHSLVIVEYPDRK
jgi:hypothetical protein